MNYMVLSHIKTGLPMKKDGKKYSKFFFTKLDV